MHGCLGMKWGLLSLRLPGLTSDTSDPHSTASPQVFISSPRVVPTTFMINYSQLPAWWFDHCLGFLWNEIHKTSVMKCISFVARTLFHSDFFSISFLPSHLFHCLPSFISFHFHFFPTQVSISFLPGDIYHYLPIVIFVLFHFFLGLFIIPCLGWYFWYFISS